MTDLIATASLVGGIFGKGGGARARRVPAAGRVQGPLRRASRAARCGEQFAAFDDPDAPTTVTGQALPLPDASRSKRATGAEQPPDPGSFKALESRTRRRRRRDRRLRGGRCRRGLRRAGRRRCRAPSLPGLLGLPALGRCPRRCPTRCSCRRANSASGHPLAVFGPQVAYFAPQILMEEDLHGAGHRRRGAAFPGVNLYVQLGHGRDYAWSATSAGQDIIDTFARDRCCDDDALPLPRPVPADRGARAHEHLDAEPGRPDAARLGDAARRAHEARARRRPRHVKGKPVLYTVLRSTYQHEVDSAVGFSRLQRPRARSATPPGLPARGRATSATRSTGSTPTPSTSPTSTRATTRCARRATTGQLPMASTSTSGATSTPTSTRRATRRSTSTRRSSTSRCSRAGTTARPRATRAPTRTSFSSVFRSQMLDRQLALRLQGGHKLTLPELVDAMEQARHHRPARHDVAAAGAARPGHAEGPARSPAP